MVAVTGANGFVGAAVLKHLAARGRPVRGIMRSTGDPRRLEGSGLEVVHTDLGDERSLARALAGCGRVVHCAARSLDWGPARAFRETNVEGTRRLVAAAGRTGVERLVHISTANVAGYGRRRLSEDGAGSRPRFPYSRSKLESERAARLECSRSGLDLVILRPSAVYGPGDWKWTYEMVRRLEVSAWPLVNGGKAVLTPVYIDNLTRAVELALEAEEVNGRAYNITDGVTVSWLEFCEKIAGALGVPLRVKSYPLLIAYPVGLLSEAAGTVLNPVQGPRLTRYRIIRSCRDFHYTDERARRELGYRPDPDLDRHLAETVRWYRSVRKRESPS
ncbi:MAG: NAD-dependent epimerase/dehydratase family protein [Spirochaetota bacterium]